MALAVNEQQVGSQKESCDGKQSLEVAPSQSIAEIATTSAQLQPEIISQLNDSSSESKEVHEEQETCCKEKPASQREKKKSGNPKGRQGGRMNTSLFDPTGYGWKKNSPLYGKDKKATGDYYVACTGKRPDGTFCFARGKLLKDGTWQVDEAKHKCAYVPNKGREQDHKFYNRLRDLAVNDCGMPKDWWNVAAKQFPSSAVRHPYTEAMARKLERWRDEQYEHFKTIKIDNISDYAKMLDENKHCLPYYMTYDGGIVKKRELTYHVINVGEQQHLLMYDEKFVHKIRDTLKFYMDATFSICPRIPGVKQFLTIMVQKYRTALPAFYAFMTRRKCEDYTGILSFIEKQFPAVKPRRGMSDYEKGMRKAMRLVFPQILLSGCFFHYCQALYRQARKKGAAIKKNKQDNEENHRILKRFMALAFLPPHKIQDAFDFLVAECKEVDPDTYWDKFIAYFRKEWLETVGPEFFSVYGLDFATNNFLESLHRILTQEMGKRPRHYKFLRKLKDLCMRTWIQLESLELGMEAKIDSGPDVAKAKLKLAEYYELLAREEMNENEFVTRCSTLYDDTLIGRSAHNNQNESDEDTDTDRESDKEEAEKDECHLKNDEVDGHRRIPQRVTLPDKNHDNSTASIVEPATQVVIENMEHSQLEFPDNRLENVQSSACSQRMEVEDLEDKMKENAATLDRISPKGNNNRKKKSDVAYDESVNAKVVVLSEHNYSQTLDGTKWVMPRKKTAKRVKLAQ